jgi:hypothetical protein
MDKQQVPDSDALCFNMHRVPCCIKEIGFTGSCVSGRVSKRIEGNDIYIPDDLSFKGAVGFLYQFLISLSSDSMILGAWSDRFEN